MIKITKYGFRDNELIIKNLNAKKLEISKEDKSKSVTYIKIPALKVGTSGITEAYLYLGSAGKLMMSSTAPIGTTGAFTNVGQAIGTVA